MIGQLDAVIFDFDGVIVDTETVEWELWREFYSQHGLHLSPELWSKRVGASDDLAEWHPAKHFEAMKGQPLPVQIERAMTRQFFERCHLKDLEPGVETLIQWALRSGLRLAVASSNNRDWVESFLVQHSIRAHFSVIRTIEDVAVGKPSPDLYQSAALGLSVGPEHCLAVEDS